LGKREEKREEKKALVNKELASIRTVLGGHSNITKQKQIYKHGIRNSNYHYYTKHSNNNKVEKHIRSCTSVAQLYKGVGRA
jgi:hypothetical protein